MVRFAIIISCGHIDKLLHVPALENGIGLKTALAVCNAIQEWVFQDILNAIEFDVKIK